MRRLARFTKDTRGATAVEYGLIVALIVIAMLASFMTFASGTGGVWNDVSTQVIGA
jgi:pilus assembly protein Flp/PilA